MKLFAIILILSVSVHQISAAVAAAATTTTCKASNYCMGCHATVADQCTNCYNQVQNKIGMKQLDALVPNTCATAAVLKVTNSKQLNSTLTATSTNTAKTTIELCDPVKGKYLNQPFSGDSTCAATTAYKGLAGNAAAAATTDAGDTAIATLAATLLTNCQQLIAFGGDNVVDANFIGQRMLCQYCKSGFAPMGNAADNLAYITVTGGSHICSTPVITTGTWPITNCLFFLRTNFALASTSSMCLGCKAGFAAASGNATCVAYTTDASCRVLHPTSTECNICKDSYYWDAKKCVLAAKMMIAGFAVVLSLVM